MSARICIDYGDWIETIFCIFGKSKKIGRKLKKHYNEHENVLLLIRLGEINILKKTLNKTKNHRACRDGQLFTKLDDYCLEDFKEHFANFDDYCEGDDYMFYIWKNDQWFKSYVGSPLKPL